MALGYTKEKQVGKPEKKEKRPSCTKRQDKRLISSNSQTGAGENGGLLASSKKRKPIKKVSDKQAKELVKRAKLKKELIEESGGLCTICWKPPDFRGLQLIHKKSLAQGGKTNRKNCVVGCGKCHSPNHGIKEVK